MTDEPIHGVSGAFRTFVTETRAHGQACIAAVQGLPATGNGVVHALPAAWVAG